MGVMRSAGGSLQWYRDTLTQGMSLDDLLMEAESVTAGCDGLRFLPYLTCQRTPPPDPLSRGVFIELALRHRHGHLTGAVLEGVSFGLKDNLTLIQTASLGETRQVRVSGGGMKSLLWWQILADVLEIELVTVNIPESAAYGAAILAGVGIGPWKNVVAACRETVKIDGFIQPDPSQSETYQSTCSLYQDLYPVLKPRIHEMSL
jgi:xylulokinase